VALAEALAGVVRVRRDVRDEPDDGDREQVRVRPWP